MDQEHRHFSEGVSHCACKRKVSMTNIIISQHTVDLYQTCSYHWYLVIIYQPKHILSPSTSEMAQWVVIIIYLIGRLLTKVHHRTKIFVLDSMEIKHPKTIIALGAYLKMEAKDKKNIKDSSNATGLNVLVWQLNLVPQDVLILNLGTSAAQLLWLWCLSPTLHKGIWWKARTFFSINFRMYSPCVENQFLINFISLGKCNEELWRAAGWMEGYNCGFFPGGYEGWDRSTCARVEG